MDDPDEDISYNNKSFLRQEDKNKLLQLIASSQLTTTIEHKEKIISEIDKLLSPFQEQPQLLGPHVLDLICPLSNNILMISESFAKSRKLVL